MHPGRCLSAAVHVGEPSALEGGEFKTFRCGTKECWQVYMRCRYKDTGDCRALLKEQGLSKVNEECPPPLPRAVSMIRTYGPSVDLLAVVFSIA